MGRRLIGVMGAGMIAGGVFVADPALGFPAGAPAGAPDSLSWHGILHAVAFGVAMIGWIGACVAFARRFNAAGQRGWAVYSAITGVLLLAPLAMMGNTAVLYAAATLGWLWTSAVSARLLGALGVGRQLPGYCAGDLPNQGGAEGLEAADLASHRRER